MLPAYITQVIANPMQLHGEQGGKQGGRIQPVISTGTKILFSSVPRGEEIGISAKC